MNLFAFFVQYPGLCLAVGIVFLLCYRFALRSRVMLMTGALWCIYAAYEFYMQSSFGCAPECNIRVDLAIIFPLLALSSIIAVIQLIVQFIKTSRRP